MGWSLFRISVPISISAATLAASACYAKVVDNFWSSDIDGLIASSEHGFQCQQAKDPYENRERPRDFEEHTHLTKGQGLKAKEESDKQKAVSAIHATTRSLEEPRETHAPEQSLKGLVVYHGKPLELKLVQAVFRHGARTPLHPLVVHEHGSNDYGVTWNHCAEEDYRELFAHVRIKGVGDKLPPSNVEVNELRKARNALAGNCKPGQLTRLGAEQTFALGERLREEYIDSFGLVNAHFNPSEVYVRSTYMTRAYESARGVLRGLFGSLESNPADIHILPREDETLIPHEKSCDRLALFFKHAKENHFHTHPDEHKLQSELKDILEPGFHTAHIPIRDGIISRITHGHPFPPGWSHELFEKVNQVAEWQLTVLFKESQDESGTLRLAIGRLLKEFLDNMKSSAGKKLILFSAHDTTLVPILCAMDAYDGSWPPFASSVIFELFEDVSIKPSESSLTEAQYVRVRYNWKTLHLPACGGEPFCKLSDFERLLHPFIPGDYAKECRVAEQDQLEKVSPPREQAVHDKSSGTTNF